MKNNLLWKNSSISECSIIEVDQSDDVAITSTDFEVIKELFDVKRVFYIYDVPKDAERGNHAHTSCHEFIIPLNGSFKIELFDGLHKQTYLLNSSIKGLYVPPGIWVRLFDFSTDSICYVLTSEAYSREGYILSMNQFLDEKIGCKIVEDES